MSTIARMSSMLGPRVRLPDPHPRAVRGQLRQVKPQGPTLVFGINPESVILTGGVGGWARNSRPRKRTAVSWAGLPERTLQFTLMLNGFEDDTSIESQIQKLETFGLPRSPGKPPPELELDYGKMGAGWTWVIDDLAWGEEIRNRRLERIYQEVTITLLQYVEADLALSPVEKHKQKNKG